jgi:hypothetical protein
MKKALMKVRTGIAVIATALTLSSVNGIISYAENFDTDSYVELTDNEMCDYIDWNVTNYFRDPYGNMWEFNRIYSINKNEEFDYWKIVNSVAKGVECRLYSGEADPYYVLPYDERIYTADTDGTFVFKDKEYKYNIIPNSEMSVNVRLALFRSILGYVLPEDDTTNIELLQNYDFKKDGVINIFDVVLFNKQYANSPFNFVNKWDEKELAYRKMSYEDFYKVLDWHYQNMEDECQIFYDDTSLLNEPIQLPNTDILDNANVTEINVDAAGNLKTAAEMVQAAKLLNIKTISLSINSEI